MPIYSYRCTGCLAEEDAILPMANRNNPRLHSCGHPMERLMTTFNSFMVVTGKDIAYQTLNKEEGRDFPGKDKHRKRYEQAMAKGLDQRPPTVGIGFGKEGGIKSPL